jgi:hypothetical protein
VLLPLHLLGFLLWDSHACSQWGPEIVSDTELSKRAHFEPWALGGSNNHTESDHPKYWTLDSLMKHNSACSLFRDPPPALHEKREK